MRFAKMIRKCSKPIEIPAKIHPQVVRALLLRRTFHAVFNHDQGHTQAMGVLERALLTTSLLEKLLAAPGNHLSMLHLPQPMDSSEQPEPKKLDTDTGEDIFEVEDDFEDDEAANFFAYFCLLHTLHHMRQLLFETWADYRQGKTDLMSASITTNTALALARLAIEEVETQIQAEISEAEISGRTYHLFCLRSEMHSHDCSRAVDFCYRDVKALLQAFCDVLEPSQLPQYKYDEAIFGTYDPTRDRTKMSGLEQWKEDTVVLMRALPNFPLLEKAHEAIPVEDELTTGLREMTKTKRVTLWLSFAAQVYLDIHHVLRADVDQGSRNLKLTCLRAKKIIRDYTTFSRDLSCPKWPKQHENALLLKGIQETVDKFLDPSSFLEWHPMQAGLIMCNITLRMHEAGIALVNGWGSVLYLAHLYSFLQTEGWISVRWPDMDRLIEYHHQHRMFNGCKPDTLKKAFFRLCTMLGFDAESLLTSYVKSVEICGASELLVLPPVSMERLIPSGNGPSGLVESSIVSEIFRDRYARNGSLDLSIENVTALLDDLANAEDEKQPQSGPRPSGLLKRKWQGTETLSTLQLLTALREKLIDEEPRLMFNYFGMHQRCIELMQDIRSEFHDQLMEDHDNPPKDVIEEEHQLPLLIFWIFKTSVVGSYGTEVVSRFPLAAVLPMTVGSLMPRAGVVMQAFLNKQKGAVACTELRAFCKNEKLTEEEAKEERNRRAQNALKWVMKGELVEKSALTTLETGIVTCKA